ncbi:MAG: c-type cytochrome [Pseudomonadota bacterium]
MVSLKSLPLWLMGAASAALFGVAEYATLNAKEAAPSALTADAIDEGKDIYQRRCGACHSIDANRIGPKHRDVFGRTAGGDPDYNYSNALIQSDLIWNEETLDEWLMNPEATIPGQKMGYRLSNKNERQAIIAYLRSQSTNSKTP